MLTRTGLAVAAAAVVIGAFGLRFGYVEFIAVAVCTLAMIVVGWITASRLSGLELARTSLPSGAPRGTPVPVEITARLSGRSAITAVTVVDQLDDRSAEAGLPSMVLGERASAKFDLPSGRRGVRQVGPLRLRRTDPFGLVAVERSSGAAAQIVIHPRIHPLSGVTGLGRLVEMELVRRGVAADPLAGFQSMRDYVAGDDTRAIHWPTTAKAGRLMVREFVDPQRPTFSIVLMTDRSDYDSLAAFEEAVDIAASIAVHVVAHDVDVLLRTTDPQHAGGRQPLRNAREALDLLARVTVTDSLTTVPVSRLLVDSRLRSSVLAINGSRGNSLDGALGSSVDGSTILVGPSDGVQRSRTMQVEDGESFVARWNDRR